MRIKLPAAFYDDHAERGLPAGDEIGRKGSLVEVEVTHEELAEIESDASYYADRHGPDCITVGLKSSARATVKRIKAFKDALKGAVNEN